jgi:hypothetical protein
LSTGFVQAYIERKVAKRFQPTLQVRALMFYACCDSHLPFLLRMWRF